MNKEALRHNLESIGDHLGSNTQIIPVIKGNAYGHGNLEIASILQELGVTYWAVFHPEEALLLGQEFEGVEILVMGRSASFHLHALAALDGVHITIIDMNHLRECISFVEANDQQLKVQLKIDTGMYRMGVPLEDAGNALNLIQSHPLLDLTGIYSHLADNENIYNPVWNQVQHDRLQAILENHDVECPIHLQNSGGTILVQSDTYNYARVGLATYGVWPAPGFYESDDIPALQPVMQLTSYLASIKHVPRGKKINYARTITADRDMVIGLVPAGYSDGLSMMLANTGSVLVNGRRAPIIGPVNMNIITLDLTDIADARVYDRVTFIGSQDNDEISFWDWADWTGESVYDLMTRIK